MWIVDKFAGIAVNKVALWFGIALGLLIGLMGLYIHHVRAQRDAALNDVVTLTQQLATERAVSEGLAQVAKDVANQASAQASAQLVQKKREISAQNTELKKEIKNVYQERRLFNTENSDSSVVATDNLNCFGTEFGRLWNAANTLRGSETTAP